MAMNGDILGTAIAGAINGLTDAQKEDITVVWKTISTQIVAHITTNAQVAVVSVSGVTTGPGVSGPGTGTIA